MSRSMLMSLLLYTILCFPDLNEKSINSNFQKSVLVKLFCPSSFIQGRCGFRFFGGVSRGEMSHPVSHVVWRGQGCLCFL